jgi:putative Mg2+ transporter-C (MgtC) family protein
MDWGAASDPMFWQSVLIALACGAVIGLERQLAGKPAGVRTSALVCLGTFVFVHLSVGLDGDKADPSRVLGQVVTGIGFLGAGVMLSRDGVTKGVTSAAVIWILAAIGAAIGLGEVGVAVATAGVVMLVLTGVRALEYAFQKVRGALYSDERGDD